MAHLNSITMISIGKNKTAHPIRAGWATICRHSKGYTLIELIVVIALLGIMIMFSVPRFHDTLFLDDTDTVSRWIIGKVQALREAAIQDQKQHILHIDMDTHLLWDTNESMSPENREEAALDAYTLPGNVRIVEVEFPVSGKISSGRADIRFYKTGHTDKVLIHLDDGDRQLSFLIEPFLTKVKLIEKYASFED
jgi:prepilin-type N-terminal cleavage/methylation domain-containing protein